MTYEIVQEIRSSADGCTAALGSRTQYVVRPPEMSKVAAVENEHSSLASQHTKAAHSPACPSRPIGMRERM
jgi:hypothetical protein